MLSQDTKNTLVRAGLEGHDGCQEKEGAGLLWEAPNTGTRSVVGEDIRRWIATQVSNIFYIIRTVLKSGNRLP